MSASPRNLKTGAGERFTGCGRRCADIGMSGTEEIYFATFHLGVDAALKLPPAITRWIITAWSWWRGGSPDQRRYRTARRPASGKANVFPPVDETKRGRYQQINCVMHTLITCSVISTSKTSRRQAGDQLREWRSGSGSGRHWTRFKALGAPVELIKVHNTPDAISPTVFLTRCCRNAATIPACGHQTRRGYGHCLWWRFWPRFLFDEKGQFIEGYYIVGLLQKRSSKKIPARRSSTIRVSPEHRWCGDCRRRHPGNVENRNAFIKERMRKEDAIYGGEMSPTTISVISLTATAAWSHGCCSRTGVPERKNAGRTGARPDAAFPASGEINSKLAQPVEAITASNSILAVRRWRWIAPMASHDLCRLAL